MAIPVTARQIELLGEDFDGQTVRLSGITCHSAEVVPSDTSMLRLTVFQDTFCFAAVFANKRKFAPAVLELDPHEIIHVVGRVVALTGSGYGLMIEAIETTGVDEEEYGTDEDDDASDDDTFDDASDDEDDLDDEDDVDPDIGSGDEDEDEDQDADDGEDDDPVETDRSSRFVDLTDKIERMPAFESRLGVRLEALSAFIDTDGHAPYFPKVRGEVYAASGEQLRQDVSLEVTAYDERGRVVDTGSTQLSASDFFGFEAFDVLLEVPTKDIARLRVYPKKG